MIPTLISRCQKHRLTKIPSKLIAERLEKVAAREGISVEAGACHQLARMAGGSLRDALGYLEQMAGYSNGDVKLASLNEYFGVPSNRTVYSIVSLIAEQNVSAMLMKVNDLIVSCVDPREILLDISNALRNIHIFKYCGKDTSMLDVDDEEMTTIETLAAKFGEKSLVKMADYLGRIEGQITININERWIVEAALVNCVLTLNNDEQSSIKAGK
jgi:DNA polymerase-3 subunit gamma/tau